MTNNEPRTTNAGFTLVEVLVALAVVAIALTGLLRLHLTSLRAAEKAQTLAFAVALAQDKIGQLEAGAASAGITFGEEDVNHMIYHWELQVGDQAISLPGTGSPGLRKVVVRVWTGRGSNPVEMTALVPSTNEEKGGEGLKF